MTGSERLKYPRAGKFLGEQIDPHGSRSTIARRTGIEPGTLGNYINGYSRVTGAERWRALEAVIGADAIAQYKELVERDQLIAASKPRPPRVPIQGLLRAGRVSEAASLLTDDSDVNDFRDVASALFAANDVPRATLVTDRAIALFPDRRGKLVSEFASRLQQDEQYEEALVYVRERAEQWPFEKFLWRRLGVLHWYQQEYVDALAAFSRARECGLRSPRVGHAVGQILVEMGEFDRAIPPLQEAIEDPLSIRSQHVAIAARAQCYFFQGHREEAQEQFEQCIELISDSAWLYWRMALCAEHEGKLLEAAKLFTQSLSGLAVPLTPKLRDQVSRKLVSLGDQLEEGHQSSHNQGHGRPEIAQPGS